MSPTIYSPFPNGEKPSGWPDEFVSLKDYRRLEAALVQVAGDLAYKDDVSMIARIAAAQKTLNSVLAFQHYPCGCTASGTYPLPTYCPEHGSALETEGDENGQS